MYFLLFTIVAVNNYKVCIMPILLSSDETTHFMRLQLTKSR